MQLLTLPPSPALATSIRATAQVFEDPKSQALPAVWMPTRTNCQAV